MCLKKLQCLLISVIQTVLCYSFVSGKEQNLLVLNVVFRSFLQYRVLTVSTLAVLDSFSIDG